MSQNQKRMIQATGHRGGLLERALDAYPTAMPVFQELVQNSIDIDGDKGATSILIEIDFDSGEARYSDNGPGMSEKTITEALNSIGRSVKGGRGDRYGRFGIGMVSPLSIFDSFEIVTAMSGHVYQSYEFDRKVMLSTHAGGWPFYCQEEPTLLHQDGRTIKRRGIAFCESVWWRTQVRLYRLTTDKVKRNFDFEKFKSEVQLQYGSKLAALGTSVKVVLIEGGKKTESSFKAKLYEGKELGVWKGFEESIGNVEVCFYLTPQGYKGPLRISTGITGNPFRVPLNADRLLEGSFYRLLSEETKAALASGMFQGEIVGDKLTLRASRKGFEEGDAQVGLAFVVDEWYRKVGSAHYTDEKSKREANRHQTLVEEALIKCSDFLKGRESPFAALFDGAQFGSVGIGHKDRPVTVVAGTEMTGKSIKKDAQGGSSHEGGTSGGSSNGEKAAHRPVVVVGNGNPRKVVRDHSTGLHVVSVDLGSRLWFFERQAACLKINPTHPLVALVDGYDARVRDLYHKIIITALRTEMQPEGQRDGVQAFAEQSVDDYVRMMLMKKK